MASHGSRQPRARVARNRNSDSHDEWYTPAGEGDVYTRLNAIFGFRLDPCAAATRRLPGITEHFTQQQDGLTRDWGTEGAVFVNPPYGRSCYAWIRRCAQLAVIHPELKIVMLLAARVSNLAWQEAVFPSASALVFVADRIEFLDGTNDNQPKGNPDFGSVLVCYNIAARQLLALREVGQLVDLRASRRSVGSASHQRRLARRSALLHSLAAS
jgi:phage N-6-adenine-methyltransferase